GLVGGKSAGHRGGLRVGGVDAPRASVDALRQLVGVRRFQLREGAVLQDALGRGCSSASSASTSSSVEGCPDGVFFLTGSFCRSNRISWICLGEPRLKGCPAAS